MSLTTTRAMRSIWKNTKSPPNPPDTESHCELWIEPYYNKFIETLYWGATSSNSVLGFAKLQ